MEMKYVFLSCFLLNGILSCAQTDTTLYGYVDSLTFRQAEVMPRFVGGPIAWVTYLAKDLKYPKDARAAKIEGIVIVEFTVTTDFHLSNVKVVQSVYPSLDKEAVRFVTDSSFGSPHWLPAIQNGRAVNYRYRQPVTFRIK